MTINFTSTAKVVSTSGIKVLVYGPSGIGKTMLAATAPKPLLISAEAGLLSLSPANIEKVFGVNNPTVCYDIPVVEISTIDDLKGVYEWCISDKAAAFETICLDSITEMAEKVLFHAKGQVKDPRQAYGELIEKMTMVIRGFRDMSNHNVYFSANQAMIKDNMTMTTNFGPAMPGSQLGLQLPYHFDEVFNMNVGKVPEGGETYRFLRTQPDLQYSAKDRSGCLEIIEKPDLTYVFNKIKG